MITIDQTQRIEEIKAPAVLDTANFEKLKVLLENVSTALDDLRAREVMDIKVLEETKQKMPVVHKFQSSRIKLNIGGEFFTTSIETVTSEEDSMLAAMFSGRFELVSGADGSFFIDRDGTHFRHILNYHRG